MKKTVFTNGCFDIIHAGHIALLEKAKSFGDKLIVGINSDDSVRTIKGSSRPLNTATDRATVLLGLSFVDEVRIFEELTPEKLIQEIKPDVLVKGGDWKENEIVGAEFVKGNGGAVHSVPLVEGYSSTKTIAKFNQELVDSSPSEQSDSDSVVVNYLDSHVELFKKVIAAHTKNISVCAGMIYEAFLNDNKLMICGNGGSASDAQHISTEFVGRYETERIALPAIALTTDTSLLTAVSNDYSFDRVFSRQVEALGQEGDVLLAISTSGNSPNVIEAVMTARSKGCKIIGLTGEKGKKLAALSDACIMVPDSKTSRIQEVHITIAHIWCQIIDAKISDSESEQ